MTKSSKLKVNASSAPATIAGRSCGSVTWTNVRRGVAKRSKEASVSERGITPEINAIASMVLAVTITALVTVGLVYRRQARQAGETAAEPLALGIEEDA